MVMIPATQADASPSMPLKTDRVARAANSIPVIRVIRYRFELFIFFFLSFFYEHFSREKIRQFPGS